MRILVTGSREWDDVDMIHRTLSELVPADGAIIVHGACPRGADAIADAWAAMNHVRVEKHPAEWDKYGKRAGFVRNAAMVATGVDLCLAFIKDGSKGASMTANIAEEAGVKTMRYQR